MVVDVVVCHCLTGVIADAESQGRLGQEGLHQAVLLYWDNGMVPSSNPCWLNGTFNTLVGLFYRVGLRKNVGNTVGMVYHLCQAGRNLYMEEYGQRVTGVGPTYKERLKGPVVCSECGKLLTARSLLSHLMTQHGREALIWRQWSTPAAWTIPQMYSISFQAKGGPRKCMVMGCPCRMAMRTVMWVHFVHEHVLNTMLIKEEGNFPHPRCA